jgi:superoxide dismutase, Cu-Zn family
VALTSIGCSSSPPGVTQSVENVRKSEVVLQGAGTLTSPNPTSRAISYNAALAPIGATMTVTFSRLTNSTMAELMVSGLLPNRGYAVHAHTKACGVTGDAAGPHFQNRLDPAATPQAPSTNPDYANPRNEIWLDVRTDAKGAGISRTTVPFTFTDRAPGSIVVHEAMTTDTHPGHAGMAGARIACLTLSGQ